MAINNVQNVLQRCIESSKKLERNINSGLPEQVCGDCLGEHRKKYMPDELKKFRVIYKEFEDRMREGVYKFGFLRK